MHRVNVVTMVMNKLGKKLAIIDGYTYYPTEKTTLISWRCTRGFPCKARFTTDFTMGLRYGFYEHNHRPPKFFIQDGICHKLG
ncbi:unnamed protein product [Leptidea sinapis]|uniref:FLYWCH-type domain-containing protein n=1 Tax=Leptidea sinapis TaxID=189913 RepID=A0A5E4PZL4_9NEOP|nr:unnamed protein product [Leptidea sinapis]